MDISNAEHSIDMPLTWEPPVQCYYYMSKCNIIVDRFKYLNREGGLRVEGLHVIILIYKDKKGE